MFRNRSNYLYVFAAVFFVLSFALMFGQFGSTATAAPLVAETETPIPTQPPPTATNTSTPIPPNTATPTATTPPTKLPPETITPEPTPQPPSEIPEPITVILFGTGLAALSAAAAKRKKAE